MPRKKPNLLLATGALLLSIAAGCTSITTKAETGAALDEILAGDHRSEANRARDAWRHPRETLLFFGLRPEMTVVEIWPGGGWYTEIIAPLVNERGQYYGAGYPEQPDNKFITSAREAFAAKLAARPDLYGNARITEFGPGHTEIAPPGTADMVVTFRNIHNWMARDFQGEAFAAIYRALKPGGILGVTEHRGDPAVPQDPKAASGYVNEAEAVRMIEAAGFRLVAKSEINANPADTKDYADGVWTLPPTLRLGDKDREKYLAIGESDRFTLKFVKPADDR